MDYIGAIFWNRDRTEALQRWARLCQSMEPEPSAKVWNLGIRLFALNKQPARAQTVFTLMRKAIGYTEPKSLVPIILAWNHIYKPGSAWKKFEWLRKIVKKNPDSIRNTHLEDIALSFLEANQPDASIAVLKFLEQRSGESQYTKDAALFYQNMVGDAQVLHRFSQEVLDDLRKRMADKYFCANWIKNLVRLGRTDLTLQVKALMEKRGLRVDVQHLNGVIQGFLKEGSVQKAEELAMGLIEERLRNIKRWGARIAENQARREELGERRASAKEFEAAVKTAATEAAATEAAATGTVATKAAVTTASLAQEGAQTLPIENPEAPPAQEGLEIAIDCPNTTTPTPQPEVTPSEPPIPAPSQSHPQKPGKIRDIHFFDGGLNRHPQASVQTFSLLIHYFCRRRNMEKIDEYMVLMKQCRHAPTPHITNHLLNLYLKQSSMRRVVRTFHIMLHDMNCQIDQETWSLMWYSMWKRYTQSQRRTSEFYTPRELFRKMVEFIPASKIADGNEWAKQSGTVEIWRVLVKCFLLARDWNGLIVALHTGHALWKVRTDEMVYKEVAQGVLREGMAGIGIISLGGKIGRLDTTHAMIKEIVKELDQRRGMISLGTKIWRLTGLDPADVVAVDKQWEVLREKIRKIPGEEAEASLDAVTRLLVREVKNLGSRAGLEELRRAREEMGIRAVGIRGILMPGKEEKFRGWYG